MKVFISWSGKRSRELAIALRDWLPCVLQYVEPFVSDKDIAAGERWAQTIASELEGSNFGIICITPENLNSEWILFESGALSKSMLDGKVIPLLFGLELSDLSGPLSQFQAKKVEQSGLLEAVHAINSIAENKTLEAIINRSVPAMWSTLQSAIDAIPDKEPTEKHMRPQHEILEELVTGVRGLSSRMRDFDPEMMERGSKYRDGRNRFHPMMLEEIMDVFDDRESHPIALLVISGMVRDELPWLSEILTESYRELKHASREEAEQINLRLRRALKAMMHGRLGDSMMRSGSKSSHMLMMELPHMIERIIDRSMDFPRNATIPSARDEIDNSENLKE